MPSPWLTRELRAFQAADYAARKCEWCGEPDDHQHVRDGGDDGCTSCGRCVAIGVPCVCRKPRTTEGV